MEKFLYRLTSECEAVDINPPAPVGAEAQGVIDKLLNLNKFAREIKKALPHCEFSKNSSGYWVYHPQKSLCMGFIGYGDYRVNRMHVSHSLSYDSSEQISDNRPWTYMVCSRTIENNKIAPYNRQHHMLTSQKIDVAVRNAKKHLRDVSPKDIANHHAYECNNKWSETAGEHRHKIENAKRALSNSDANMQMLLGEIMHLKELGHTWRDPSITQFIDPWIKAHEDKMEALEGRTKGMLFVAVNEDLGGNRLYSTAPTSDISNYSPNFIAGETYTEDTIPEALSGKLSVLSLCDNEQYVDNVGWRVSDTLFYVVQ